MVPKEHEEAFRKMLLRMNAKAGTLVAQIVIQWMTDELKG
jgi:hypothetical protein